MMTQRDFKILARALHDAKPEADCGPGMMYTWVRCVDNIAYVLKQDNPRFDARKFRDACDTGKGAA